MASSAAHCGAGSGSLAEGDGVGDSTPAIEGADDGAATEAASVGSVLEAGDEHAASRRHATRATRVTRIGGL